MLQKLGGGGRAIHQVGIKIILCYDTSMLPQNNVYWIFSFFFVQSECHTLMPKVTYKKQCELHDHDLPHQLPTQRCHMLFFGTSSYSLLDKQLSQFLHPTHSQL
jgi:hypothetical protein